MIIDKEMKPFSLYLHRINVEILKVEYKHICVEGVEKKKLTMYPNIIVKCKDIGQEKNKE